MPFPSLNCHSSFCIHCEPLTLLSFPSFSMKVRSHDCANGEPQVVKITVYEYFTKHCGIELTDSACLPCLDVGNTKQPIYLPIEVCWIFLRNILIFSLCCFNLVLLPMLFPVLQLCTLVPLQRYAKALFPTLRASLVASSRQNPQDRKRTVIDVSLLLSVCYFYVALTNVKAFVSFGRLWETTVAMMILCFLQVVFL